jgi:xanthine dehydrogenase accessory factor
MEARADVAESAGKSNPRDAAHAGTHRAPGVSAVNPCPPSLVVVKGGGDLGSGVAWRLRRCGFPTVVLEQAQPTVIRRAVAFAAAMYEGSVAVEGITGRRATLPEVPELLPAGVVPVLADPQGHSLGVLRPAVLVDAILAKRNTGTRLADAPLVIALGPGFRAGRDCHAVVETARGHTLGRVYWQGEALPNSGTPGEVMGVAEERVLRAPAAGTFQALLQIGDRVEAGQPVAMVHGQPVPARVAGVVRGLLHDGLPAHAGMKVGDIDPRGEPACCFTVSDKALAVAGGVLEAILSWSSGAPAGSGENRA